MAVPRFLLALPACLLAFGGGCGGDDDKDVKGILDKAFKASIRSADVKVDANLELEGVPGLNRPVRLSASGPFRSQRGRLPAFDIDFRVGVEGGGASVETGRLSTGDRAFVKYQGTFFELPRSDIEKAKRQLPSRARRDQTLASLGLDPRRWIEDAKDRGDEKVAGADTRHVSGTLDVQRTVTDLNRFVSRAGGALGATGSDVPKPLPPGDVEKISQVVRDPSFDIYVDDDNHVRRISANLRLEVPESDRSQVGGLRGGSLQLTVEFRKVNGDQRVQAPRTSRPISDLQNQLGGAAGGLGGALGGGIGATPPTGNSGGGSPGGADAQDFQRYSNCLDKADAQDTNALQRCTSELRAR